MCLNPALWAKAKRSIKGASVKSMVRLAANVGIGFLQWQRFSMRVKEIILSGRCSR